MKFIPQFTDQREELNEMIDLAIHFAATEAFGFTLAYMSRLPEGNRFGGGAVQTFEAAVAAMILKDRATFLRSAAMKRAGLPTVPDVEMTPVNLVSPVQTNGAPRAMRPSMPRSVTSPAAAAKLDTYIRQKGITISQFAALADTTPKTISTFLKTGKVKIAIFESIASAIGTTKDALLDTVGPK